MKLTNEEIARVFAMYIGSDVLDDYEKRKAILVGVRKNDLFIQYRSLVSSRDIDLNEVKLSLTPLSKITDEHKLSIYAMGFTHVVNGRLEIMELHKWPYMKPEQHHQLVIWRYAVKLHFGIGHWANGKTAIELEIALDVTEKNGLEVIKQ
jgi:hypothetical protein